MDLAQLIALQRAHDGPIDVVRVHPLDHDAVVRAMPDDCTDYLAPARGCDGVERAEGGPAAHGRRLNGAPLEADATVPRGEVRFAREPEQPAPEQPAPEQPAPEQPAPAVPSEPAPSPAADAAGAAAI